MQAGIRGEDTCKISHLDGIWAIFGNACGDAWRSFPQVRGRLPPRRLVSFTEPASGCSVPATMAVANSLLALMLTGALSGCSLVAIQRPPGGPQTASDNTPLPCTDGLTYPLIDATGTVLASVLAVSLISSVDRDELKIASYSSAGIGVALAASAIYGLLQVKGCREAKQSQGQLLPSNQRPLEDREPPGTHGGACKEDGSCEDDLYCDGPMKVCVPLNPRGNNL